MQDLCDSQNVAIHDVNHTHKNVHKQYMNSVTTAACGKQIHANQHLEECIPPSSFSYEMLQPLLADQAKLLSQGNKNKTGFFDKGSANMEEQENDNSSTLYKEFDGNKTLSNVVTVQSDNSVPVFSYMYIEPCLTTHEICTLEGNKTELGLWKGHNVMSEISLKINAADSHITTASFDRVTTVDLDLFLNQNYYHNNNFAIECYNQAVDGQLQKNLVNAMNNEPHKFGFCPLTPLE